MISILATPRAQTLSARKLNDQKKSGVNCAYGNSLVGERSEHRANNQQMSVQYKCYIICQMELYAKKIL